MTNQLLESFYMQGLGTQERESQGAGMPALEGNNNGV
jgi:hypothetical protein